VVGIFGTPNFFSSRYHLGMDTERSKELWDRLALLATFAGALAGQVYYEITLEPTPRNGFEFVPVAYGAVTASAFSFPFVLASALVAGAALALASTLRRA
jgi:uncharacterized membrane protein YpjA